MDGSGLLIPLFINGFLNGLRAVLRSGWQRIAHSSARQRLSRRFARRVAQRIAVHSSFFRSLTAFPTVCAQYCSADSGRLHILSLVNGFHDGLPTVLLHGWQHIAHSSARHQLFQRSARRIAQWVAAYSSYFRSSTAFTTVCAPYCSVDSSRLLILPLVNGFHGLRAVFLSEWQCVAHSSTHHRLSQRFVHRFP